MSENQLPGPKASAEIRPNKRDFGFVLIGIALGIAWGSALPYPVLLILGMGLVIAGNHLISLSKSRGD
jgi:hypothetical protein